jgi:hypothetical protein
MNELHIVTAILVIANTYLLSVIISTYKSTSLLKSQIKPHTQIPDVLGPIRIVENRMLILDEPFHNYSNAKPIKLPKTA